MINGIRSELRFAFRSFVIPIAIIVCALIAVGSAFISANAVESDYSQLQATRAQYEQRHASFEAALSKPDHVVSSGGVTSTDNPARFDYDTMVEDIAALSPANSIQESFKFLGFLVYPIVFFLVGLWLATGQRRYRLDKVTLVRMGGPRSMASKQIAMVLIAAMCVAVTLAAGVVTRSALYPQLASQLPLSSFHPLSPLPAQDPGQQWAVMLLVTVFFGGAGIAVGTIFGVFAIPAIVFIVYDFIVPVLGTHDPRNWLEVLGHAVFTYSMSAVGFQLADPKPLALPIALGLTVTSAVILVALGYVGIRIRNPRAT
jgi:hypothetical protein